LLPHNSLLFLLCNPQAVMLLAEFWSCSPEDYDSQYANNPKSVRQAGEVVALLAELLPKVRAAVAAEHTRPQMHATKQAESRASAAVQTRHIPLETIMPYTPAASPVFLRCGRRTESALVLSAAAFPPCLAPHFCMSSLTLIRHYMTFFSSYYSLHGCVQVVSNHISQLRPYLACAKASSIRATLMAATGSVLLQVRGGWGCVQHLQCLLVISTCVSIRSCFNTGCYRGL
jgi:hypothetical protein